MHTGNRPWRLAAVIGLAAAAAIATNFAVGGLWEPDADADRYQQAFSVAKDQWRRELAEIKQ